MHAHIKNLFEQVKQLPTDEQIELADLIYLETALPTDQWEAAWAEEGERRMAEYERGETTAIDSEEVFARLKQKYGWQ